MCKFKVGDTWRWFHTDNTQGYVTVAHVHHSDFTWDYLLEYTTPNGAWIHFGHYLGSYVDKQQVAGKWQKLSSLEKIILFGVVIPLRINEL